MRIDPKDVHSVIGKHMLADALEIVVDIHQSKGSYLRDARTGKDYLDMTSFFASQALGMNHPALDNPEFIEEIGRVAVNKITNSDFYTPEMAELVAVFSEVGIPDYLPYLFFVEGGGLAVENALKTAFDWKHRKNLAAGREVPANDLKVIHFRNAFHGRTGYTLPLTNTADPRKYMYFPLFDWPRLDPPSVNFPLDEAEIARVSAAEEKCLAEIRETVEQNPGGIAALIIEGIMGEGGDRHFRPEFMQSLRKICDELEIFFIIDEVQSGVGVTGKFWAHEHYGVKPDCISFGKKSQVCGILAGPRVEEVDQHVFVESSRINSTWGGNFVDMVRFRKILEVIRDEKLLDNATTLGERLLKGLQAIADKHECVTNARGKGLFCAIDVPADKRQEILDRCYANGMIILPCGNCSIRFRPALAVTADDIDKALEILEKSIS